jgi:hypothetical protein
MAELADAHALGACALRRVGSNPTPGTSQLPYFSLQERFTLGGMPAQPNIQISNTSEYRENYANSVQIRVNVWDFFLVFGTLHQQSEQEVEVRNFQGVYLSPQQAKALMTILEQNVISYEKTFGEIKLDPKMAATGVVH